LRGEKTAFSSRATFLFPLQGIAVPPGGKKTGMSSIDCRGPIPITPPQNSPELARALLTACRQSATPQLPLPGVKTADCLTAVQGSAIDAL
jgi:hypothetical protein